MAKLKEVSFNGKILKVKKSPDSARTNELSLIEGGHTVIIVHKAKTKREDGTWRRIVEAVSYSNIKDVKEYYSTMEANGSFERAYRGHFYVDGVKYNPYLKNKQ